jgi:hypothetical protein
MPGPLPAAPRRALQFAKAGSFATMSQQEETNNSDQTTSPSEIKINQHEEFPIKGFLHNQG